MAKNSRRFRALQERERGPVETAVAPVTARRCGDCNAPLSEDRRFLCLPCEIADLAGDDSWLYREETEEERRAADSAHDDMCGCERCAAKFEIGDGSRTYG